MIDEQVIRERAYALWEQRGRPEGPSDDYWHEARQQLEAEQAGPNGTAGYGAGDESQANQGDSAQLEEGRAAI